MISEASVCSEPFYIISLSHSNRVNNTHALISLSVVLHLSQRTHNIDRFRLARQLLKRGIGHTHEHVMLLLITNREFSLRLFVCLRVLIQFLDCIVAEHAFCELHVTLGVLVSRVHFGVVGKSGKYLIQRLMHLFRSTLEETAASADEESITGKDSAIVAIFHEVADAVLGVAGSVQGFDFDGTDVESGVVRRGLVH
jgi:hypothetical protein